jgi:hypothetical protein
MADYGFKISRPEVDVRTAELKDLLFHSEYPLLKLKQSGSVSLTFTDSGSADTATVSHNLGYEPRILVYSQIYDPFADDFYSGYRIIPHFKRNQSGIIYMEYSFENSTTQVTFRADTEGGDSSQHTVVMYYFIFYDEE